MSILSQDTLLLDNISKFYDNKENFRIMSDIINKRSNVSRRLIDWFVTNYAKKNNIHINSNFYVYQQYKNKLKGLNKHKFDPFCRSYAKTKKSQQFKFVSVHGEIITTIGQLNFFQWAIENKIIDYINNNYSTLFSIINSKTKCGET